MDVYYIIIISEDSVRLIQKVYKLSLNFNLSCSLKFSYKNLMGY
jgi:hypothetical protein